MSDPARDIILGLAAQYGIGPEVEAILDRKGQPKREELGPLLRERRLSLGMGYEDVRDRCNIARSQLVKYELGRSVSPGLRTVHALAHGYKLPFYRVLLAALHVAR